jgi:hypothetical protein
MGKKLSRAALVALELALLSLMVGCASKQETVAVVHTEYDYLSGISVIINSVQLDDGIKSDIVISNPRSVDVRVFETFQNSKEEEK